MPNLSVIVTGRNDNYDGNFDDRLAIAMKRNIEKLPDAEFIFVEWNPIPDRPLTSQGLKNIFGDRIRYIVVHPRYHDDYCKIDGFLEYPPKNVGIRRAKGDFIVCTNSDVIFYPELAEKLNGPLKPNIAYRAIRVDIRPDYMDVAFPLHPKYKLCENSGATNAAGDFLMLDKATWHKMTGYCEAFPEQRLHKDAFAVYLLTDIYKIPVEVLGYMTHWRHASSWSASNENRPKVGDIYWDYRRSGFIKNFPTWGLKGAKETEQDGITWIE